jgi:uncharacterized membrane protein YraQ (UPF0718 family)
MGQHLSDIVSVLSCCIFTPKILSTVLPAFLLAGAVAVFMPKGAVLRYLGPRASRTRAYLISPVAGMMLSMCSCNIVPLFLSIYRAGAGIGPAFTFLFAAPAFNVLSFILTFKVIGWRIGVWRIGGVLFVSLLVGLISAWIYRREEKERVAAFLGAEGAAMTDGGAIAMEPGEMRRGMVILTMLLALVITGSLAAIPWSLKIPLQIVLLGGAILAAFKITSADHVREWGMETWALLKMIMPILLPCILLIAVLAYYIDVKTIYHLVGTNSVPSMLFGSMFGGATYFPILTEIAFTKAFLKLGMATGPALAILLTGPGLSLPGTLVLARVIGWKKAGVYWSIVVVLSTVVAIVFSWQMGQYMCPCITIGK